jgi:hypothetical protein
VKRSEESGEILEAYDLAGSCLAAAEMGGYHAVTRHLALRAAGEPVVAREHRARPIDEYLHKIEELVARSNGRLRADVVHRRLVAMGFTRGERTTRRAGAEVKKRLRTGPRRVFPPWVGARLWLQWDWGEGRGSAGGGRACGAGSWPHWRHHGVVPEDNLDGEDDLDDELDPIEEEGDDATVRLSDVRKSRPPISSPGAIYFLRDVKINNFAPTEVRVPIGRALRAAAVDCLKPAVHLSRACRAGRARGHAERVTDRGAADPRWPPRGLIVVLSMSGLLEPTGPDR